MADPVRHLYDDIGTSASPDCCEDGVTVAKAPQTVVTPTRETLRTRPCTTDECSA
jgi:hypothetical protein